MRREVWRAGRRRRTRAGPPKRGIGRAPSRRTPPRPARNRSWSTAWAARAGEGSPQYPWSRPPSRLPVIPACGHAGYDVSLSALQHLGPLRPSASLSAVSYGLLGFGRQGGPLTGIVGTARLNLAGHG